MSSCLLKLKNFRSINQRIFKSFPSIRHCASQTLLKSQSNIQEQENENILQMIQQQQTKDFDRYAHKNQINIQRFSDRRKQQLHQIVAEEQELYHPVLFSILSAQNASEILHILNTLNLSDYSFEETIDCSLQSGDDNERNLNPSIHRMYCKAIRCCADLNEMNVCWQIFELCKAHNIISNELYNTMMWISMYKERSLTSLRNVFSLYDELQSIISSNQLNLSVHPRTYSTVLNSCYKARNYEKALSVISDLKTNKPEIVKNIRVKQAMIRIYAKLSQIDECIQYLDEVVSENEIDWDDVDNLRTFDVLRSIAHCVRRSSIDATAYIEKAEMLFKKSVSACFKNGNEVHISLINEMILVYAMNGDYKSCHDLLKVMVSKQEKYKLFPAPITSTFHNLIKALANDKESGNEHYHFEEIGKVLKVMDTLEVSKTASVYCEIFTVFEEDVEKARLMYDKMISEGIEPNMAVLRVLFNIGEAQYKNGTEEKTQFVKWIIEEHRKYKIIPTDEIKFRWRRALD